MHRTLSRFSFAMIVIAVAEVSFPTMANADEPSSYDRKSVGIYRQLDYVGMLEP